jgi:hypothetical protein
VVFRTLLFKLFNKIETWELRTQRLGSGPAWARCSFAVYSQILDDAMGREERI